MLRLRPTDGSALPSGIARLVFANHRFNRPDMILGNLLNFGTNSGVTPVPDGNAEKQPPKNGQVDSIDVTLPAGASRIDLPYTVAPGARRFKFILVRIFPPGTDPTKHQTGFVDGRNAAPVR